jgi:hypothetical protein
MGKKELKKIKQRSKEKPTKQKKISEKSTEMLGL